MINIYEHVCILLIPPEVPSRARVVETFAAAGDGSNSVTRQKFQLWPHVPKMSQIILQLLQILQLNTRVEAFYLQPHGIGAQPHGVPNAFGS